MVSIETPMTLDDRLWDVVVIGAGISGLSARKTLLEGGASVLTLEKSRGLSGRASTRRFQEPPGVFADLGAQFVSAKTEPWKTILNTHLYKAPAKAPPKTQAKTQAKTQSDTQGVQAIRLEEAPQFPRYVHQRGMSRFGRLLVEFPHPPQGPILCGVKALRLEKNSNNLFFETIIETGQIVRSTAVVLTAPLPQSLNLLEPLHSALPPSLLENLKAVSYSCCLAGAYILEHPTNLEGFGILKNPSTQLAGIYDQRKKGLLTDSTVVVVHGAPEFSQTFWKDSESAILAQLWDHARRALPAGTLTEQTLSASLHKWLYCEPQQHLKHPFEVIQIEGSAPILLAGDAFGGPPSVEGAFESGRLAGDFLKLHWTTRLG